MDIFEEAHIDLSEQIDNPWSKDSALAIRKGKTFYSIKIRGKDKNEFKKLFIKNSKTKADRKNNRRVVVIIYSFLLYHLLKISKGISLRVNVCNDVGPSDFVNMYLIRICNYYGVEPIQNTIKLDFKKRKKKKSKAHNIAKDISRGRIQATLELKKPHLDILTEIIKRNISK